MSNSDSSADPCDLVDSGLYGTYVEPYGLRSMKSRGSMEFVRGNEGIGMVLV